MSIINTAKTKIRHFLQKERAHILIKDFEGRKKNRIFSLKYSYLDSVAKTNTEYFLKIKDYIDKKNVNRIEKKDKIQIAFVIYTPSMWSCDQLYMMLKEDPHFEPIIIIGDFDDGSKEAIEKNYQEALSFFNEEKYNVIEARNRKDLSKELSKTDIVFYSTPYNFIQKQINLLSLPLHTMVLYSTYSFMIAEREEKFNLPMYYLSWKFFSDTAQYKKMMEQKCISRGKNVLFYGFPRMDEFYKKGTIDNNNIWKNEKNNNSKIYRIIYAPHHSVFDKAAGFSTFDQNCQFILELAKKYKNNTSWIIKPHPLLRSRITRNGFFKSVKEYDSYLEKWQNLPNARVVTGGNYFDIFKTSDAMILDSISFLTEYQYVHKPLLFLTRDTQRFNSFGKELQKVLYQVRGDDFQGIEKFFEEIIFRNKDPMKKTREAFFRQNLDYYNKNNKRMANESIYELLKETFIKGTEK